MTEHLQENAGTPTSEAAVPPAADASTPSAAVPPADPATPLPELVELLRREAPHLFTEGRLDFDRLRLSLGDAVQKGQERYGLSWAGKSDSFRQIQQAWTGKTLRPCREESVNFDTTQNLFIEGENLQVLKLLQRVYHGKVKMIYIDPPYNTGSDSFVYPDRFKEGKEAYQRRAGVKDDDGNWTGDVLFRKNSRDNGHYHSNWLTMMYPRLFLARQLLRDDGVIFVSIDDNEVNDLRLVMEEIFGDECFVAAITLLCNPKGRSQDKYFATNHEYLLAFSKQPLPRGAFSVAKEEEQIADEYPEEDAGGKHRLLELRNTHREFGKHNRKNLFYPFYVSDDGDVSLEDADDLQKVLPVWDDGFEGCWTWEKPKALRDIEFLVAQRVHGRWKIYRKSYASGADRMLKTILADKSFYTERGQKQFNGLFNTKEKLFQSPKAPALLAQLIQTAVCSCDSPIVLDFFAGSATTAQAVLELNRQDGGNRRFICVQLPEPTPEGSAARQAGYATIAEIGKERIRRVIKKLQEDDRGKLPDMQRPTPEDLGFKVFKLAERGLREWECAKVSAEELAKQLEMFTETVRADAKGDDLLYELILDGEGELAAPVERMETGGGVWYRVDGGRLAICVERPMTPGLVESMLAAKPQKLICVDAAFAGNDALKKNTALQLADAKIEFKTV